MIAPDINRVLPQSPDAERALLGSILLLPDEVFHMLHAKGVTRNVFFETRHQTLFALMDEMWRESDTVIDLITFTQKLIDRKLLDSIGDGDTPGAAYVGRLFTEVPTAANASFYADILLEKHTLRRVITTSTKYTALAYDEQEDIHGLLKSYQQEVFNVSSTSAELREVSLTEEALGNLNKLIELRQSSGTDKQKGLGLTTGVVAWDEELHGIFPRRFYALGARPKVGKSSLIEQISQHQIANGVPVLIFQRDMSVSDMIGRMACRAANVVYEAFMRGDATDAQLLAVRLATEELDPKLLRVYSPANMTVDELACIVEREIRQSGIQVFYLDLFQRLKTGKHDKVEGLVDAANTIRDVIQSTGISGVIIAEVLKAADETKRPHSGQFKYCDGLFSSCDTSVMLWSDDDPKQLTNEHGYTRRQRVQFTIDANRGGSVGERTMFFDRPKMIFHDKP